MKGDGRVGSTSAPFFRNWIPGADHGIIEYGRAMRKQLAAADCQKHPSLLVNE